MKSKFVNLLFVFLLSLGVMAVSTPASAYYYYHHGYYHGYYGHHWRGANYYGGYRCGYRPGFYNRYGRWIPPRRFCN